MAAAVSSLTVDMSSLSIVRGNLATPITFKGGERFDLVGMRLINEHEDATVHTDALRTNCAQHTRDRSM